MLDSSEFFATDRAMDHYSITDHEQNSMMPGSEPIPRGDVPHNGVRSPQGSVSAAIAAATPASSGISLALNFPAEDGGRSLAEMASRDLDAALQLLAERAQYITEASGAAIALRRNAHNTMLCRASAGSNAPELGTLLSTEFGLSGESVRTRLPLRCDNADRDPRVNREGCRQLGIASVAVLPIVSDDQVLGVFELFSGKINAFEERDLSALQRLGEMVETAVKLAHAAQHLPPEISGEESDQKALQPALEPANEIVSEPASGQMELPDILPAAIPAILPVPDSSPASSPRKPLLWFAALHSSVTVPPPPAPDQSHVPPVLRTLHKCQACGFPVSEGRKLCVECEEKQWRGVLRAPRSAVHSQPADPPASDTLKPISTEGSRIEVAVSASRAPVPLHGAAPVEPPPFAYGPQGVPDVRPAQPSDSKQATSSTAPAPQTSRDQVPSPASETAAGQLFLSAEESWFSANKYIIGSLLLVAAVVAIIAMVR